MCVVHQTRKEILRGKRGENNLKSCRKEKEIECLLDMKEEGTSLKEERESWGIWEAEGGKKEG